MWETNSSSAQFGPETWAWHFHISADSSDNQAISSWHDLQGILFIQASKNSNTGERVIPEAPQKKNKHRLLDVFDPASGAPIHLSALMNIELFIQN